MGVSVGTMAMILGAGAMAGSTIMQAKAQREYQKQISEANQMARDAAAEQRKELVAEQNEERKERVQLVDDMRAQLGAGLSLPGTTSTKYRRSAVASGNTLG